MLIVSKNDFTGFFELPRTTASDPELQSYIDSYEKKTIYELLGVELGELFIADIVNGVPIDARFIAIFNSFALQDNSCGKIYSSAGIKSILLAVIYYHYVLETQTNVSQSGAMTSESETGSTGNNHTAARKAEIKFNWMLHSVEAVQYKCSRESKADYPEYKGQKFKPQYSALL